MKKNSQSKTIEQEQSFSKDWIKKDDKEKSTKKSPQEKMYT